MASARPRTEVNDSTEEEPTATEQDYARARAALEEVARNLIESRRLIAAVEMNAAVLVECSGLLDDTDSDLDGVLSIVKSALGQLRTSF
jgi:hypothetical protein